MVRIVNQEKPKEQEAKLTEKSKALLEIIGIIIADKPKAVQELLEEYSVEFSESPDEKELTDKLISAIGESNKQFNDDLARIILDCTLESEYDSFDFKSLFKKGEDAGGEEGEGSGGGGGGGIWAGIGNAIGGIAGSIGGRRRAREEATSKTLQGIYAYRAQLAANEQNKSKNKKQMIIALFVVLGIILLAATYFSNKKQKQQTVPALKA